MSGCRSRQDLTFQYPCSLRFPLLAGGTKTLRFPSRSGGNLKEGGNSCNLNAPLVLDPAIKGNVTRLGKGELVLEHAIYRQPVKVVFPLPAYRHGCG